MSDAGSRTRVSIFEACVRPLCGDLLYFLYLPICHDFQITKDDKLQLIDEAVDSDNDMYVMKNLNTKKVGLVSKIFVAKEGTIESEPWVFSWFSSIARRQC